MDELPDDKQLKEKLDKTMDEARPYCQKCKIEINQEEWEGGGLCIQCI